MPSDLLRVVPTVPSFQAVSITAGTKKPPVDPATLTHKDLLSGPFWQKIPAYRAVDEAQFLDHSWQSIRRQSCKYDCCKA